MCYHFLLQGIFLTQGSNLGQAAQVQVLRYSSKVQTRLGLRLVPFPGPSSLGDEVFGECGHCDLLPLPSLLLGFLGVQLAHLLRRMSSTSCIGRRVLYH